MKNFVFLGDSITDAERLWIPEYNGLGNFCPNCGGRRPAPATWTCSCGTVNTGKFCPNCGNPRP